jgi:hypothetical protein
MEWNSYAKFWSKRNGLFCLGCGVFHGFGGLTDFRGLAEWGNRQRQKQGQLSGRLGLAFTPAFGRAVFRFAVGSYGTAEAVPLSTTGFQ